MTDKPIVLLVGGLLTSGKDTFADFLVANHGFVKLGMSDTLAEALRRLNPILGANIKVAADGKLDSIDETRYQDVFDSVGYVQAKEDPEVRRLLQVLGTEVGRELLGKNIWVTAAANRILEQIAAGNTKVVLTGARFPNELEIPKQLKNSIATTVWVDRPSLPALGGHASETSVSSKDFKYVLDNSGDLKTLEIAAGALLDMILKDHATS